jgi:Uma2 family endonuclease
MGMSVASAITEIEYPESDGKPMGETDVHRVWMNRLYDLMRRRYAGQQVYIGCDLLVYYEEGNPLKYCVPDVFVVKDSDPGFRRTFQIWKEQRSPDVVFEVTSRGTSREDLIFKPQSYARMGVKEYFLYDPTAEYLKPPLKGFRLREDTSEPIAADAQGRLESRELGVWLWLEQGALVLADAVTDDRLLTVEEASELRAAAADLRARDAVERAQVAEAEVRRLREELSKSRQPPQT